VDGLNWEEFFHRQRGEFDRQITGVHFYHNLVVISKGQNEEGSNREVAANPPHFLKAPVPVSRRPATRRFDQGALEIEESLTH
jgi:hypothetical protein